jgi:hypothetical protein
LCSEPAAVPPAPRSNARDQPHTHRQQLVAAVDTARAPPFPVRGDRCEKPSAKPSCETLCCAHSLRNLGSCAATPHLEFLVAPSLVDRGAAARQPGSRPASSSRQAWVKGHCGHPAIEWADGLAMQAMYQEGMRQYRIIPPSYMTARCRCIRRRGRGGGRRNTIRAENPAEM